MVQLFGYSVVNLILQFLGSEMEIERYFSFALVPHANFFYFVSAFLLFWLGWVGLWGGF